MVMRDAMSRSIAEQIEGHSAGCPNCAALRGEVERLKKREKALCSDSDTLSIEIIRLQAALSRYRDAVEDVEEIAKMMCFVCCGYPVKTVDEYEPIWKSIGESIKDEWRKRAAAVQGYLRRRAGEG